MSIEGVECRKMDDERGGSWMGVRREENAADEANNGGRAMLVLRCIVERVSLSERRKKMSMTIAMKMRGQRRSYAPHADDSQKAFP